MYMNFMKLNCLKKNCVICTHDTQRAKYFNAFILGIWYFVNL